MRDIDFTRNEILIDNTLLPWELEKKRPEYFGLFLRSSCYPWSVERKFDMCLFSSELEYEAYGFTRCACCGKHLLPFEDELCNTCSSLGIMSHEAQWIEESNSRLMLGGRL